MRSRGHRNPLDESPGTERETSLPGTARAPAKAVSETVEPMSSGVSVRRGPVACGIARHEVPTALQRRQRYVNLLGEPVHVPTELVRTCPSWVLPSICGSLMFAGRAAGELPAGETAAVGALAAEAVPGAGAAVTRTLRE